ncbi:MAG TPA: type 1 glutamine amidotransferase domain-containing protein [Gemmatimonadaceae bacterium]|nr:type 1 glutamine amidotransferase domain-containing protein [Gemmatimonadaceae bacterium]
MQGSLQGKKVAFLATDGVNEAELTQPREAFERAGAEVHLLSIKEGEIQSMNGMDKGKTYRVDRLVENASSSDYVGLVLPGGVASPDKLRMNEGAVRFVRDFFFADKPVAAICHALWLLVEADVVRGRTVTSYPSLRTDIKNAGGTWVDQMVQVDQQLVTSRNVPDIPAFNEKSLQIFSRALQQATLDEMGEASFPASDPPSTSPTVSVRAAPEAR